MPKGVAMRLKSFAIICMAIADILSLGFSHANQEEFYIDRSGITTASALSGEMTAKVIFHTVRINKSNVLFPQMDDTPEVKEVTIVRKLEIFVNNVEVIVPPSAYADLIDPIKATLRADNDTFVLKINGGDASLSYFLRLYFDAKQLHRRVLYCSSIPDEPIQETLYWLRTLKDVE
jgi:hypothetical protein